MSEQQPTTVATEPTADPDEDPIIGEGLLSVSFLGIAVVFGLGRASCEAPSYGFSYSCAYAFGYAVSTVITVIAVGLTMLLAMWARRWTHAHDVDESPRIGMLTAALVASLAVACGVAMVDTNGGPLLVALLAPLTAAGLTAVGHLLGLRLWFVPATMVLVMMLGGALIESAGGSGDFYALWYLVLVPWAVAAVAAPPRTPRRWRVGMVGVLLPTLVLVIAVGRAVVAAEQRAVRLATIQAAEGAPLYAPVDRPGLRIHIDEPIPGKQRIPNTFTYVYSERGKRTAAITLTRLPPTCEAAVSCERFDESTYKVAQKVDVAYIRLVPGGAISYERLGSESQEETLEILRGMKPVSVGWLADNSE